MRGVLILLQPLDPATNTRTNIRVGLARNARTLSADGVQWHSAISRAPQIVLDFMDLTLQGGVQIGRANATIDTKRIAGFTHTQLDALVWRGAPVTIWSGDGPLTSELVVEFVGRVQSGTIDKRTKALPLAMEVNRRLVDVPLLNQEYGGGGGADGDVEMRGQLKPAAFGKPVNVPVLFFDRTNNVGQIDAYGNVTAINELFEDAASFGTKQGDYATYAALVAATLTEGQWATSIAQGMIRLGTEPRGVITCDPICGSGTPGAMMLRWLQSHAALSAGNIDSAAFTSLDSALATKLAHAAAVSFWTQSQVTVQDRMEAMCASVNATPFILPNGKVSVSRIVNAAAPVLTFQRFGGSPPVLDWRLMDPPEISWRLKSSAAVTWRVHSNDEIDYNDDIVDLGDHTAGTQYREGNVVRLPSNGIRYIYINATPSTTAPPAGTHWEIYEDAPDASVLTYVDGTAIEYLKPAEPNATKIVNRGGWAAATAYAKGDLVTYEGTSWFTNVAHTSNASFPPGHASNTNMSSMVSSVTTYLTNESATVSTLFNGTGGTYGAAGGTFKVFNGLKDVTTGNGVTYSIVSQTSGLGLTLDTATGVYAISAPTVDTGTATLRATYGGVPYEKVYSFAKSKGGDAGGAGLSIAEVTSYQRAASAPATPTGGSYNFDTKVLTPPAGWSATIPAGTDPLYAATGTASIQGTSGNSAPTWAGVGKMAQDGAPGVGTPGADGSGVDVIFIRSATQPATPAASVGTPAGWYSDVASVPASNNPLWTSFGQRANSTANYTWDTPARATGPGGPVISITSDAQGFKFVDGVPSPVAQTINITGNKQNTDETISWTVSPAIPWSGDNTTRTIAVADFGQNRQVVVTALGSVTGVKDTITIVRLDQSTAAAGASSSVTFKPVGGAVVEANTVKMPNPSLTGWTLGATSLESYAGTAMILCKATTVASGEAFIGLNDAILTTAASNFQQIDYAFYTSGGNLYSRINGDAQLSHGGFTLDSVFSITYDGVLVRWYHGTTLVREATPLPNRTFYCSVALGSTAGLGFKDIIFGAYSQNNWSAIGGAERDTAINFIPRKTFNFASSTEGFFGQNCDVSWAPLATDGLVPGVIYAGNQVADPIVRTSDFPLPYPDGRINYIVRARIRATQPGIAWDGFLFYETTGHGYSTTYSQQVPAPVGWATNDWCVVEWDMRKSVTPNDYLGNGIKSLRFDFMANPTGLDIDWVTMGDVSVDPLIGRGVQDNSDRTLFIQAPTASTVFKYNSAGTAESGQFNRDFLFKLMGQNGEITSGVTWTYEVMSGAFNGGGVGTAGTYATNVGSYTVVVGSLGSAENVLKVGATYLGKTTTFSLKLTKDTALPGGGVLVSKTGNFTSISSSAFVDMTGTLTGVLPAGKTEATITVDLSAMPVSGANGNWTVEMQAQAFIGGVWTNVGAASTATSSWIAADFSGTEATINMSIAHTGLTGGTTYNWRVLGRVSVGATRTHGITGSVIISA